MFKIATLNKIATKGMTLLDEKYTVTSEVSEANAILV